MAPAGLICKCLTPAAAIFYEIMKPQNLQYTRNKFIKIQTYYFHLM